MSWGTKITVLYMGFIALIITMVSLTMRQRVDLEMPDYYEQELKYQQRIDKITRANELTQNLKWNVSNEKIIFHFPSELKGKLLQATVLFLRPSNASFDKNFTLKSDTALTRELSLKGMKKGVYKMQLEWRAGKTTYYNEGVITINK